MQPIAAILLSLRIGEKARAHHGRGRTRDGDDLITLN